MGIGERKWKVVIPGGTGQLGVILARAFQREGHEVVVLSRTPRVLPWRMVIWDATTLGDWAGEIDGADAVINLAGRSVNCRYHSRNRLKILSSRVESTRVVGEAIAKATRPPPVWLQASTATIYAHRFDAPNDERSGKLGGSEPDAPAKWGFSVEVAKAWERAMEISRVPGTRKVILRTAMVMSPDKGGIFDTLLGLVRRGLGGRSGNGSQFVSWIHEDDFVNAARWLIQHQEVDGPINIASPGPISNIQFMRDLREAWGIPLGMPASTLLLEIGAFTLRTETELVLKSRRVIPGRLLSGGFGFLHPSWPEAAENLCNKWMLANR